MNSLTIDLIREWLEAFLTRSAGPTPPSHCRPGPPTRTPGWGPARRTRSCTAGTSGSAWRSSDSHSLSTSDTFCGKVVREGESRDWCQVRLSMFIIYHIKTSLGICNKRHSIIANCLISFCQFELKLFVFHSKVPYQHPPVGSHEAAIRILTTNLI